MPQLQRWFDKNTVELGHGWVITPYGNMDVITYPRFYRSPIRTRGSFEQCLTMVNVFETFYDQIHLKVSFVVSNVPADGIVPSMTSVLKSGHDPLQMCAHEVNILSHLVTH